MQRFSRRLRVHVVSCIYIYSRRLVFASDTYAEVATAEGELADAAGKAKDALEVHKDKVWWWYLIKCSHLVAQLPSMVDVGFQKPQTA